MDEQCLLFIFAPSVIAVGNSSYQNRSGGRPPNVDFCETEQFPSYHLVVDYEIQIDGSFVDVVW